MFVTRKTQPPGYRFRADRYEQLHIIIVTSGRLDVQLGNRGVAAGAETLVLLRPGSTFELSCTGRGYRGIGVIESDDLPDGWFGEAAVLPAPEAVRPLAILIEKELQRPRQDSAPMLEHLGRLVLDYTLRSARRLASPEPPATTPAQWAEMARQAIHRHLHGRTSLDQALSGLDLGYRQLARHFRACIGISMKRYQMQQRIEEAKRLLAGTELSTVSIAMELGFPSSQHFAHRFRKYTGHTPTQFRRRAQSRQR